jgi:hypothetical protein
LTKDNELDRFKTELLSQATDDATGVYEALWTANSLYPDWPTSLRLALVEKAITELSDAGLIRLSRGKTVDRSPVARRDVDELLRDWRTWAIPDGPEVFLEATEEGRRSYFQAGSADDV